MSGGSGRAELRSGAVARLFAMLVTPGAAAAATESELLCLPSDVVRVACEYLHGRLGVTGDAGEGLEGYRTETDHMLHRRLRPLENDEAAAVKREHTVVFLRPILEAKKDGRREMRLVVQGFEEPLEWDLESNMSPAALTSAVRMLVYAAGRADEAISCIDVSVAFLQADEYGPEDRPRCASLRAYPGAKKHVFQCRGQIYGMRSASRAWYRTVVQRHGIQRQGSGV